MSNVGRIRCPSSILILVFIELLTMFLCAFVYMSPVLFSVFVLLVFYVTRPKYLCAPQNMVYLFYFMWYGVAPTFASRYSMLDFSSYECRLSYFFIMTTFLCSIAFLTVLDYSSTGTKEESSPLTYGYVDNALDREKNLVLVALASFAVSTLFFILYIQKTGGFAAWHADSKMSFISRGGAGVFYLGFVLPLYVFYGIVGYFIFMKKKWLLFFFCLLLIAMQFIFIGSKGKIIQILLLVLALTLIQAKTFSKWTLYALIMGVSIFFVGIIQRNVSWITMKDLIPYSLNYFDTFDQLLITIRDFSPNFMQSFLLPLNKILLPFGLFLVNPHFDLSVWLTSIYYPHSSQVGATVQFPIETDMYLSFYYVLGLPVLLVYWKILYTLFQKAKQGNLAANIIYFLEFTSIISHLRGGLLIWWYWYLIPFYILINYLLGGYKASWSKNNTLSNHCI